MSKPEETPDEDHVTKKVNFTYLRMVECIGDGVEMKLRKDMLGPKGQVTKEAVRDWIACGPDDMPCESGSWEESLIVSEVEE